ncbi:MAG: hypothetical protein V4557_05600 [Bacteroidota bacterium]
MLKFLRYIITILAFTSFGKLFGCETTADTVFLLKGATHAIFIDTNKHSMFYDKIADFTFGQFDSASYSYSLGYLKSKKRVLTKNNIRGIPRKWVILNYYKNQFYTYHPSDFYSHFKVLITDTAFIDFTGEGPCANKIVSYKRLDKKTMFFSLESIEKPSRQLIIHMIDEQKGIAVFEEPGNKNDRYHLMIDVKKMRQLPIIVNYCTIQKEMEMDFDTPDFKKLLGNR